MYWFPVILLQIGVAYVIIFEYLNMKIKCDLFADFGDLFWYFQCYYALCVKGAIWNTSRI